MRLFSSVSIDRHLTIGFFIGRLRRVVDIIQHLQDIKQKSK